MRISIANAKKKIALQQIELEKLRQYKRYNELLKEFDINLVKELVKFNNSRQKCLNEGNLKYMAEVITEQLTKCVHNADKALKSAIRKSLLDND